MPMNAIVIVNKKGGVGKTNTAFHLAGELARRGRKVLCVDLDFQANLTSAFLGNQRTHALPPRSTAWAIAEPAHPLPFLDELAIVSGVDGVDLVPGSLEAEDCDLARPESLPAEVLLRLRSLLAEAEGYDDALIDCHPGKGLLTYQALLAGTAVLVPLNPENSGAQGVGPMLALFEAVRRARPGNPGLRCLGLLLNRVEPRVGEHASFEKILREDYGDLVLAATLPKAVAYAEALGRQRPIWRVDPKGQAASRMAALASEVLGRLDVPDVVPITIEVDRGRGRKGVARG